MTGDDHDRAVRDSFHRLRQADERSAPTFAATWQAADAATARRSSRRPLAIAAGLALAVLAGAAAALIARRDHPADPPADVAARGSDAVVRLWQRRSVALVTRWESPTGFLLGPPPGGTRVPAQEDGR